MDDLLVFAVIATIYSVVNSVVAVFNMGGSALF